MFTWKRLAIGLACLSAALLALQVVNVPRVAAQVKAALVRSVDEPARVPYLYSAAPTCPFGNDCYIQGPAVPAGKRLRVTRLEGALIFQTGDTFYALHVNNFRNPLAFFSSPVFNGFFYGNVSGFNMAVDHFFEAGESPVLEVGCSALNSISNDPRSKLSIVGYIVDTTP